MTVTGQTKSGKTVLVRKVLPRETAVWVDGGVVSEEDDFWQVIMDQLDLFQGSAHESSSERTGTISGKASAGANFLVAKGEGEIGGEVTRASGMTTSQSRQVSSRVAALRGLETARVPLVIDDFHYLPRELQGNVIRALKPLIFDGLPVVIIAIPHRRYDALKVEKEMTGRILPVQIPIWSEDELRFISDTGFSLLNYDVPETTGDRMSEQAIGSPHLMQEFCRGVCRLLNLQSAASRGPLPAGKEDLEAVFKDVADTIGRPIFEKLAKGPRQRSDRMPRELKDGGTVDIYELTRLRLRPTRCRSLESKGGLGLVCGLRARGETERLQPSTGDAVAPSVIF